VKIPLADLKLFVLYAENWDGKRQLGNPRHC
jgi:hypothetical protein